MGIVYPPISMLGGVNLFTHPSALGDSELVRSKNMAPINHKRMSKRLGVGYLGGIDSSTAYPVAGIISPHINLGDVVALTRPADGSENLTAVAINDGETSAVLSQAFNWYSQRPWMFCGTSWVGSVLTQFVIVLAGPDAIPAASGGMSPPYPGQSIFPNGASWSSSNFSLGGANNEYLRPKVASAYKRRTVYANFGPGYENTIAFTDNEFLSLVGDDILAKNGRAVNLTVAQDGDEIVALVEVMLFNVGSPAASALLVLRRFGSPFLVTGELDQTTGGTSSLDIKRISVNAGCANPYTVARTPYGIIWAGQDDVWCFEYGTVRNIGLKIQPALQESATGQQIWWSGAFHNGFYRLAIWGPDQDYAFPNAPGDQWWLHLDGGLPKSWQEAEWYGPQQIVNGATTLVTPTKATRVMLAENRASHGSKLYGIEVGVVSAEDTRNIVLVSYDQNKGRDLASNPDVLDIQDTNGCEIEGLIVSREMDVEPNLEKSSDGLQGTVRPDNDLQLIMSIIPNAGDDRQQVAKQISPGGFRANINTLNTDPIGQVRPSGFSIYAQPGNRPLGNTFQFELEDTAGYVIGSWNKYLVVATNTGASDSDLWVVTLDEGAYTLTDLLDHIETRINAGKPSGAGDNWVVDLTSGKVRFQATDAGNSLVMFILFTTSSSIPTEAQLNACRQLMGVLGFDTSLNSGVGLFDTGVAPAITGYESVYPNAVSHYELWGLKANIEVFPREP